VTPTPDAVVKLMRAAAELDREFAVYVTDQ
jgi:hypothetical protein